MGILILSLVILLAAPVFYKMVHQSGRRLTFLDRSVFIAVALLVLFELVTHSIEAIGWWALPVALVGWLVPYLFEANWHQLTTEKIHNVPLALACTGLVVHGFLDGMALYVPHAHEGEAHFLPWAVIIHRLPLSVFLWWLLYPRHGWRLPSLVLFLYGLSTLGGYFLGEALLPGMDHDYYGGFEALVAGSLLHLAVHNGHKHDHHDHHHGHHHH